MGSHPINLTLRFLLEITALLSAGVWGLRQSEGWLRFTLAFGIPLIIAVIWGTFAVPDDPSRSGKAPVPTPGILRLLLELAIFGAGVLALYATGNTQLGLTMGIIVVIHYVVSYDRVAWLIRQQP